MSQGLRIHQALPSEVACVADLLTAAAARLVEQGAPLWDLPTVAEAAIQTDVGAGLYYMAQDASGPVGVFRFQLEDPDFWPEIPPGSSAFVHKLAVHPSRQGRNLAHALLGHAVELASQQGRRYLRLDCMAGRPKLSAVYERFGFRSHSEIQLGPTRFRRYELEVWA